MNITTHNLGFPRIGAKRELKFALEKFWQGNIERDEQQKTSLLKLTVPNPDFSLISFRIL